MSQNKKLAETEFAELRSLCNDPTNYTDGGHWLIGEQPDCSYRDNCQSRHFHTIHFPTDTSAQNWNQQEDNVRLACGAMVTYLVMAFGGSVAKFLGTAFGATLFDYLKGLLLNAGKQPVERGWRIEFLTEVSFSRSVVRSTGKSASTITVYNHENKTIIRGYAENEAVDEPMVKVYEILARKPDSKTSANWQG